MCEPTPDVSTHIGSSVPSPPPTGAALLHGASHCSSTGRHHGQLNDSRPAHCGAIPSPMDTRVVQPASSAGSPAKRHKAARSLAIDLEQLEGDPQAAALSVLCLLDGWHEAKPQDVEVQQLSGAMTNLVFRVAHKQQVVLLRVHASKSDLFERSEEIATFQAVAQSGIGPKLLLLFANGRVEEFLGEHVTLGAGDLRDPEVSAAIATATAEFHYVLSEQLASSPLHSGPMIVWTRLWHWLTLCERLWELNGSNNSSTAADGHGNSDPSSEEGGVLASSADEGRGDAAAEPAAAADGVAASAVTDGAAGADAATELAAVADGAAASAVAAGGPGAAGAAEAAEVAAALVQLRRELPVLQALLMAKYPCWVAMCHNDLQYGNIMVKAPPAPFANGDITSSTSSDTQHPLAATPPPGQPGSDVGSNLASTLQTHLHLRPHHEQPQQQPDAHPRTPSTKRSAGAQEDADIALRAHSACSDSSYSGGRRSGSRRLPDGSFALPDVESRPRGQSPVRNPYERALGAGSFGSSIGNSFGSSLGVGAGSSIGLGVGGSAGCDSRQGRQQQRQQRFEAAADAAVAAADAALAADGGRSGHTLTSGYDSSSSDDDQGGATAATGTAHSSSNSKQQQMSHSRLIHATAAAAAADGPAADDGADGDVAAMDVITGHRAASHGSESMRLIDYEYSGFNPIAFDIANHWCEWAADYHGPDPATMDYSRMPDSTQRQLFIDQYLDALLRCMGVGSTALPAKQAEPCAANSGSDVALGAGAGGGCTGLAGVLSPGFRVETAGPPAVATAAQRDGAGGLELRDLWQWLELYEPGVATSKQISGAALQKLTAALHEASLGMVCLSAAQWALWGWLQLRSSDVDYDFAEYARQRWAQYLGTRPAELQ